MATYADRFGEHEITDDWPEDLPPPGPDVWGEAPGITIGLGIGTGANRLANWIEALTRRALHLPPRTLPPKPR